MPEFKKVNIDEGKKAFLSIGCAKCHGDDGRGMMASNVGTDAWGNETKAADLTSGMLRGGTEPLDIYRHIDAGINGTPMPSFRDTLKAEPAATWNLVSFVLHVADSRRRARCPIRGSSRTACSRPCPAWSPGAPSAAPSATPTPSKTATVAGRRPGRLTRVAVR